ncbi:glucokinase [Asticcacaulis benevestitus]|uniref:Glucokinase n=1 Tax=Asticcacaulis benevestitus DSM 16100 = ATCC BAA-896 TaxID=1121022 RepID=V4PXT3_9CAUL|nr:glucokinase [Asticcacaulis benevestitus]ESQ90390.1 hypothetical protein ABENE_12420 [Asticcacaulis benevestitus DSM 16100 = ATCC BAA-896]
MSHVLLCDFTFGSYIKLALGQPGRRPEPATLHACADRDAFDREVLGFLKERGDPKLLGVAISSRGWERRGVLQLPDEGITLIRDEVRDLLGVKRLNLVNNFVARAMAIPHLKPSEREQICGEQAMEEQVIAVLGPHHGLGLAALAPDGAGHWTAMPCEGGHSDLPIDTEREWQVWRVLHNRFGHVARECAVSLSGLVEVWQALHVIDQVGAAKAKPEEIVALARGGDARALEAISLSMGWLAGMASDVGLILGARGGIYLTGDLMDMLADLFDRKAFCARYLHKGRLTGYVSEIPVYRTLAPDLEIMGLATLFD